MLSAREMRVLYHLRTDARKSLTAIAKAESIPVATVYDIVLRLQSNGIIHKLVTIPDYTELGFPIRVVFGLFAKDKQQLLHWLSDHANVNNLHKVTHYDAFVETYFSSFKHLEQFKEDLQHHITDMEEFMILEELKHEGAMFPPADQ